MLLYYITDRTQLARDESARRQKLHATIAEAVAAGVDYIQLREKDLSSRELAALARVALEQIPFNSKTKLLINSRTDVALAVGAHGVHLRSDDINAAEARVIFSKATQLPAQPVIAVSCHTAQEVAMAEAQGADFAVFGPVFEKSGKPHPHLDELRRACSRPAAAARTMPVFALGGVTIGNAAECALAGAAGIAAIRVFQQYDIPEVARKLRAIASAAQPSHQRHPYF